MWFCDFGKKFEYSIRYAHGNMKNTLPILKERNQKYFKQIKNIYLPP